MTAVEEVYKTWLGAKRSEATKKQYSRSVNLFFNMMFNKDAWEITEKDLKDLKYSGTTGVYGNFIKPLREKGNKDSTIKAYYSVVGSYLSALRRDDAVNVNVEKIKETALNTIDLNTKDGGHNAPISNHELKDLKSWLKKRSYYKDSEKLMGQRYAMVVDFMYKTAIRLSATFEITWSNFTLIYSQYDGEKYAKLCALDKGRKLNTKHLPYDYYLKLKSLFYNGDDNECVFSVLNKTSLAKLISDFGSEVLGRSVSPHSLKVGGASELYARTKDIMLVKDFADHEDISVTQNYIRLNPDPGSSGTAIMMSERDVTQLDKLSKEELLALIHERADLENSIYVSAKSKNLL